jgi:hypothetical protein
MSANIYDLDGNRVSYGLQSSLVCDVALRTARLIAALKRRSVIVEDRGTRECYRVTPAGLRWKAPRSWEPVWVQELGDDHDKG